MYSTIWFPDAVMRGSGKAKTFNNTKFELEVMAETAKEERYRRKRNGERIITKNNKTKKKKKKKKPNPQLRIQLQSND
jgi:hypothetical protein